MVKSGSFSTYVCALAVGLAMSATPALAADVYVASAADLQSALNAAQGGDTVFLAPGTYTGNFKLPVHGGTGYVTVRTLAGSNPLPGPGTRITPDSSPYLAKLVSPNSVATLKTAPGAAYWRLELLEFGPGASPSMALVEFGDGSSAQNSSSLVPHHLVADRLYIHGDRLAGQKRGIGLNSGDTSILNSYVAEIKAVAMDTQALAGWNGPGPYRIENNYFEAAGTAVLFGGDDPKITNLVPSDITFKDNTVTRPVSWRDAVLATPSGVRASFVAGGSLATGTYGYRVVARRMIGTTAVKSTASIETTVTVDQNSAALVQWNPVADATDYLVYGRTVGAENRYWIVKSTSFTDDGVVASSSGTPSAATVWQLKNLFELKNARRVLVQHNLLANNWAQAQSGTAILFTTRNQGGNCTWCVVEQVTFENNVVRSIGGGFQVTGFDNLQPSLQGNGFVIRNNLFVDLSKSWGGKGYLASITDTARDVTFDHNTIISPDGSGIIMADTAPITGFVFTNNLARHNTYGIQGSGYGSGNKAIAYYFPGSVITRNALAGASASNYPTGNFTPTIATFESHFVNYAGGNYALVPGTDWQAAGTDGYDLGADMTKLKDAGASPAAPVPPLKIMTTSLPDTTEQASYAAALVASGGAGPYSWTVSSGTLPLGVALDGTSGNIGGSATASGDYPVTVKVSDCEGRTLTQALSIRVIPRVVLLTTVLNSPQETVPFAQALQASGGLGTYIWAASSLPAGLAMNVNGVIAGTPTQPGKYPLTITVSDAQDATRAASGSFVLEVRPRPNYPPVVSLSTSMASASTSSAVPVGSTITLTANATDGEGNLARVDIYAGSTFIATSAGPSLTTSWLVPSVGPYELTAVATDALGLSATSTVTIATRSEIVLYASDVRKVVGNYQIVADATAAGGSALWNSDLGVAKVGTAAASPASYAEFTFFAEAGRPYHLWIRGRAQKNSWANDSAFVQFSNVAGARVGTAGSFVFNLEEATNAGVSNWGWEDNGWGTGVLGADVVFDTTGPQTIRIQPREDGLYIDQIVLSPQTFVITSPGTLKNDSTIVPR